MAKKRGMLLLLIGLLSVLSQTVAASKVTDKLADIGIAVLKVFKLEWIDGGDMLVAFTRLAIWWLIFAIFLIASHTMNMGRAGGFIAFLLATISIVFIPAELLLLIGGIYGTVITWGLIFAAILGVAAVIYRIPAGTPLGGFARIGLLSLLFWIFWVVSEHAEKLASAVAFADAAEIGMWFVGIWIIVEVFRLVFAGFGAGAGSGGFLGFLNNLFTRMPGSGGERHGGGGGHGGSVDLSGIERAMQQGFANLESQNKAAIQEIAKVNTIVMHIQTLTEDILKSVEKIKDYFQEWYDFFVATVVLQLQRIEKEIEKIPNAISAANTALLDQFQKRFTQFEGVLERIEKTMNQKWDDLARVMTALSKTIEDIKDEIKTIKAEIARFPGLVDDLEKLIRNLPNADDIALKVKTDLEAEFKAVKDLCAAITVDIEPLEKVITDAEGRFKGVLEAEANEVKAILEKILSDKKGSMSRKLNELLRKMNEVIEEVKAGKNAAMNIKITNENNQNVVATLKNLIPAIETLGEKIDNVSVGTVAEGDAVKELKGKLTNFRGATAAFAARLKALEDNVGKAQRTGTMKDKAEKVKEAKAKLWRKLKFNLREEEELADLSKIIEKGTPTRTDKDAALKILRMLKKIEKKEVSRTPLKPLIILLENLGIKKITDYIERYKSDMESFDADKVKELSGEFIN